MSYALGGFICSPIEGVFVVILLPILFFIGSFIVFICSECVTYRPNFKMFFLLWF